VRRLWHERSVKFEECPMNVVQEEPIADSLVLVDVDLSDSYQISDDDGAASDLDE
jgi:hypothetical protein